jgi:hypothetical protein
MEPKAVVTGHCVVAGVGAMAKTRIIGGDLCREVLKAGLISSEPRDLLDAELQGLWEIFREIGRHWGNVRDDSAGLHSSWLEFVTQRATTRPSYVGEYANALRVMEELVSKYTYDDAFQKLFFDNGLPTAQGGRPPPPTTRLAHAKQYVVDEFMKVQIVAGGFKDFVASDLEHRSPRPDYIANHRAFIAGSRFNRIVPVRPYRGPGGEVDS